jgi:hypothetical protein
MKNKKILPLLIVSTIITACSGNINPLNKTDKISNYTLDNQDKILSEKEISDFDKEYTFSTKELTKSYLKRKLDKWLDSGSETPVPRGHLLVKEAAYARYKHPVLFCTVMSENEGMLDFINEVQEVKARKNIDPGFAIFLETGCSPPFIGEFKVNTNTINDQWVSSVAMDDAGDFVISWADSILDGSNNGVFARRYDSSGIAQDIDFKVNTFTTGSQVFPSIAMDSDGDFEVTWCSFGQDGSNYGIYTQRYNQDGIVQGTEFKVNTFTTSTQFIPKVAMDSAGDFVITWRSLGQDGDPGNYLNIYAQRYNTDGVPQGTEFKVNTFTTSSQNFPSIAMDNSGNFVIAWESTFEDGNDIGIFAQRYGSTGLPNGTEFQVNTYFTNAQRKPSVAMDADGDFVVAWQSRFQDSSEYGIYARRYNSDGVAQGTEFRVNTNTTDNQETPAVAMDNAGDFVVSWQSYGQEEEYYNGIYAQRYNSAGVAQIPSACSLPVCNPDTGEFRVNTYTTNNQGFPSIAMDSSGNFLITWTSLGQDGSSYGVYAQRYNSKGRPL